MTHREAHRGSSCVILDANVLFPFRKRDVLLHLYHVGLFRARWTEQILEEWTRNLLEQKPDTDESIRSQRAAMNEHFPEALVTGHEPLIAGLNLPDPDDRHVLAAAIQCDARYIVTDNLSDFPANVLDGFEIKAISADEFLSRTFDLYTSETLATLRALREKYRKPSYSAPEFVLDFMAKGLPKFATRIREYQDLL